MKKSVSLLLVLALLVSVFLYALADGSDAVLALYVQNEGKDAELVRR